MKNLVTFNELKKTPFLTFLIYVTIISIVSLILSNLYHIYELGNTVYVSFYSIAGGTVLICIAVYLYPIISRRLSIDREAFRNPGEYLLRGVNGELPRPKRRELEELIRKTKI